MAYEERETGNLIGSDKVEGTAVYGGRQSAHWLDRTGDDRQDQRQSRLRGAGVWRLPRDWRRSLSASVAIAQIRHQPWRLRHGNYRQSAERSAKVQQREQLELVRPYGGPIGR